MKDDKMFKVGDKIVRFGQVYKIFKIKSTEGKRGKVIFFRHYFKSKQNKTLIYSIPVKNIDKTNIRRPVSKEELKLLVKKLSKKSDVKKPINLVQARGVLCLNDIYETAQILKSLWIEENDESANFSESKKDVFGLSKEQLVEEIAFVSGISLVMAREKIKRALKRGTKNGKQNKA